MNQNEFNKKLVLFIVQSKQAKINLHFIREQKVLPEKTNPTDVFVTFVRSGQGIPTSLAPNHFYIPFVCGGIYQNIISLLTFVLHEIPMLQLTIHLGWISNSWFNRLLPVYTGFQWMRLYKKFPEVNIEIEYLKTDQEAL